MNSQNNGRLLLGLDSRGTNVAQTLERVEGLLRRLQARLAKLSEDDAAGGALEQLLAHTAL